MKIDATLPQLVYNLAASTPPSTGPSRAFREHLAGDRGDAAADRVPRPAPGHKAQPLSEAGAARTTPRLERALGAAVPQVEPNLEQEGQRRAFGFRELGLFGAGAPTGAEIGHAVADGEGAADMGSDPHPGLDVAAPPPLETHEGPGQGRAQAASIVALRPEPAAAHLEAAHPATLIGTVPVAPTASASKTSATAIKVERGGRVPFNSGAPRPTGLSANASVIVTEQDGALQVVAAAAGLTPDAHARLRAAAAGVAAEFGLSLNEFSINGDRIDAAPPNPIGGPHGRRTR
jgi:hypothetical protein